MRPPEIRPFADEHLDAAATLLASRHRAHRAGTPLLDARFEEANAARTAIEDEWHQEGASGAVALRGGRVVGYLFGASQPGAGWGANVLVSSAGVAAEEPETIRDLYGVAAGRWVDEGHPRHYALVPPSPAAWVDAWWRLSFGCQQVHGIAAVREEPWPDGVREAVPGDAEAIMPLAYGVEEVHLRSPVFTSRPAADDSEIRAELADDIVATDIAVLVAERDGQIAGMVMVVPVELSSSHTGLARPAGQCLLGYAATRSERRGTGIGRDLTAASFAWAHRAGYTTMVTDWRVTNLLASRFWPSRFEPAFLRLYRSIP